MFLYFYIPIIFFFLFPVCCIPSFFHTLEKKNTTKRTSARSRSMLVKLMEGTLW